MNCKDIFEKIDALSAEYLDMLETVCSMETPTADKARVDALGDYFADYGRRRGWRVDVFPVEVSGNVVTLTMNEGAKGEPISLSGHIDTVHPVGLFGYPAVTRDDKNMYGPGVADCKGGIIAGLLAMAALDELDYRARPVRMLLQTDEEKGSTPSGKKTIRHICETAKDSKAFFNLEDNGSGDGLLVTTKGIARYLLTIHGRAAHSSRRHAGASAILEASHKIIALEEASAPEGNGITYNCGVIEGGTVANSVAAECRVQVDVRYNTAKELLVLDAFVREIAARSYVDGTETEVALISERPATELCERNVALWARANEIFAENGLSTYEQKYGLGGTDMAYVTQYGIPCIDSLGVRGGNLHSIKEYMVLDSLAEMAKRLALLVVKV